jgi:hypothetical protein
VTHEDLGELLIGYVGELCAVVFGDDELVDLALSRVRRRAISTSETSYRVSFAQRAYVEKCERLFALEELEGGDFS